jgi:hypothetical protein
MGAIPAVLPLLSSCVAAPNPNPQPEAALSLPARCWLSRRSPRDTTDLSPRLRRPSLKVQTRAVGAVHNISSEPEARAAPRQPTTGCGRLAASLSRCCAVALLRCCAFALLRCCVVALLLTPRVRSALQAIKMIRRLDGIGPLIALLRAPSAAVCGSAAGALQNLSRESSARREIREMGAVVPLADLLFGDDVQSQVCAAGAILNLLGPDLGPETETNEQRQGFKKLLSIALTIGMVTEPLRAQQQSYLAAAKEALPPKA